MTTTSTESLFTPPPANEKPVPSLEERSQWWSDLYQRDRDRGYRYGYHLFGWAVDSADLRNPKSDASNALAEAMFAQNWRYGVGLECSEDDSNELVLGVRLDGNIEKLMRRLAYLHSVDGPKAFGIAATSTAPSIRGIHTTELRSSQVMLGESFSRDDLSCERLAPRRGLCPVSDLPARLNDANAVYGLDFIRAAIASPAQDPEVSALLDAMLANELAPDLRSRDWTPLLQYVRDNRAHTSFSVGGVALLMEALLVAFQASPKSVATPGDVVLVDGSYAESLTPSTELDEFSDGGWRVEQYREHEERRGNVNWGFTPRMLKSTTAAALADDLAKAAAVYARALSTDSGEPYCESVI